jgi:hypothetical protein
MAEYTSYLAFWMVMFVLLGAFWYIVDRKYGVRWYRLWYRLTHEHPLPPEIVCGFVYNRRARHRSFMATLLSTVQTVVVIWSAGNPNLLIELILWIVEIPLTMVGFAVGPLAFKIWGRKEELFDTIDDLEQGKTSLGDLIHKKDGESESVASQPAAAAPEQPNEKAPGKPSRPKDDPPDDDPREMLRRYTKR